MTRAALVADQLARGVAELADFRGSLGLLVRCEGYRGRPYWPGGASGVTLDHGWDLGHGAETAADLQRLYGAVWSAAQLDALEGALSLRGAAARQWLAAARRRWAWPITREQAAAVLPHAAAPYWVAAVRACPALRGAPPRVQTALLSVTYSAWTGTARAARGAVARGDWAAVAAAVRAAPGDAERRALESALLPR